MHEFISGLIAAINALVRELLSMLGALSLSVGVFTGFVQPSVLRQ